jgi:hypothetical protein
MVPALTRKTLPNHAQLVRAPGKILTMQMKMNNYQERVSHERRDLQDKITKLESFVLTSTFLTLPDLEQAAMLDQLLAMRWYRNCLDNRIQLWSSPCSTSSSSSSSASSS